MPSVRMAAALAAATLVAGGVVGAALGPGPAPSVAAAPQRLVALVVPQAPPVATTATTTGADAPPPTPHADAPSPRAAAADDSAADDSASTPAAATKTTRSTATDEDAGTDTTSTDDASATAPAATSTPAATAPAHIWLVSLPQTDPAAFAAGGPYADLAAQGILLSNYAGAAPSAAANAVALLGGQVPTADCDADVGACVLPAGETSLPDQVSSINLTWKAYVEDAALRCAHAPSARVATSLFTTLRQRADCAQTTVGLDALDADLADAATTPAFSLVVPTDPATSLHRLVAAIMASEAYKKDGVLVIAPDTPPPGALVLSPRATAGKTVDTATGPVALLRSFDALLGLDPLATAAQAPAGALDDVLAAPSTGTPTTSTPTTTSTTTRRSP
ncbi:MAG TPA: hypothetical protein VI318_09900 [Baekduia sp.]